jgi:hypothetical protein
MTPSAATIVVATEHIATVEHTIIETAIISAVITTTVTIAHEWEGIRSSATSKEHADNEKCCQSQFVDIVHGRVLRKFAPFTVP